MRRRELIIAIELVLRSAWPPGWPKKRRLDRRAARAERPL